MVVAALSVVSAIISKYGTFKPASSIYHTGEMMQIFNTGVVEPAYDMSM